MRISVFGLGYVGAVTAGCLARQGHAVVGVDVLPQKVESFNRGQAPIIEPGLDELLRQAKESGLLRATPSCDEAIADTELSIVCVGTPSAETGALDLGFVRGVTRQIAGALRDKPQPHALVFRSTMLPGSTATLVQEFLADRVATGALDVFYFPEFLREGTGVADFDDPSLAVVGTRDGTRPPSVWMQGLFGETAAVTDWPTAELVKYACNAFHAAKVAFANEIGRVSKELRLDGPAVMALLCQDTRLNLSSSYLRPGNPFGGSCLPKDIRALSHYGRQQGQRLPLIESLLPSNERHLETLLGLIFQSGHNEVVILGLTFKPDTDDLRESAMVEVAQVLLSRGLRVRIYDPALNLATLVGSNKRLIEASLPHLAALLHTDLGSALGGQGVVVAAQPCVSLDELRRHITPRHHVVDVNGWRELRSLPAKYEGFCW